MKQFLFGGTMRAYIRPGPYKRCGGTNEAGEQTDYLTYRHFLFSFTVLFFRVSILFNQIGNI
jgi:hypothetical protein